MKKRPNSPTPLPRFYRSDSQHAGHSPFFSAWFTPPIEFLKETLSQKGKGLLKAEGLGKKLNAIVAEEGA
ncbi:MAG: hypothetical protein U9P12_08840, partial [Verrucomicrobiota bacterium]|nr:hypothetical protein [Verrucomicrobiota bacterium]